MHTDFLKGLNSAQHTAVMHTHGPLLVLAGAGSGKTRVVTCRIARLIRDGVRPNKIVAVTFTNKAAKEMRERLKQLLGTRNLGGLTVSTFHSLAARILRRHAIDAGVPAGFTILDASDQLAQLGRVLKELRLTLADVKPHDILRHISDFKNKGLEPHEVEPAFAERELAREIFPVYDALLRSLHALDFDDLLRFSVRMLEQNDTVRALFHRNIEFLLVDEYQDTNPIQSRMIDALVNPARNLCVVGDDDQSIYGFRGSVIENILKFHEIYAPATVIKLETNYRSTQVIIDAANGVIHNNTQRNDKTLVAHTKGGEKIKVLHAESGEHEAELIAREISALRRFEHVALENIALLYRSNPQSRLLEDALKSAKIPFRVIGGQSFYQRKEVKNILAYLSLIHDPDDELAFRRVVNLPARGIGDKAVDACIKLAAAEQRNLIECAAEFPIGQISARATTGLRSFGQALNTAHEETHSTMELDWVACLTQAVLRAGFQKVIDTSTTLDEKRDLNQALDEVMNAIAHWCDKVTVATENMDLEESWLVDTNANPLQSFLERIALDEEEERRDQAKDKEKKEAERGRVSLMSLHASKGLEFPYVFLVGFEEGLLPHHRSISETTRAAIEEERRLAYVGITRAEHMLYISHAKMRRKRGGYDGREPSRFLIEIPEETLMSEQERESSEQSKAGARADTFFKMFDD